MMFLFAFNATFSGLHNSGHGCFTLNNNWIHWIKFVTNVGVNYSRSTRHWWIMEKYIFWIIYLKDKNCKINYSTNMIQLAFSNFKVACTPSTGWLGASKGI